MMSVATDDSDCDDEELDDTATDEPVVTQTQILSFGSSSFSWQYF